MVTPKTADGTGYSDADCWRALQAGEAAALGTLSGRYYRDLYHYGTKFTTDPALIEDVLQDLFLGIWEKRTTLATVASVKAYLFTALRHNVLHQIHRTNRLTPLDERTELDEYEAESSPESQFILTETDRNQRQQLSEALDQLPRRQREAVYLKYYEELSYDEIAGVMGLGKQVVANYLHQALMTLKATCRYVLMFLILNGLSRP